MQREVKTKPAAASKARNDSTARKKDKGPVLISDFLTPQSKVSQGLTTLYEVEGKHYIGISDSLIGRDIIMVSRISKAILTQPFSVLKRDLKGVLRYNYAAKCGKFQLPCNC